MRFVPPLPSLAPAPALALALGLALAVPQAGLEAQSLVDPVLGSGEVRLSGGASFHSWRERFGLDGTREPLAADLTRESAASLFPGLASLESALAAVVEGPLPLRLGPSSGLVSHNEVRVPMALDVGVLDRVTLGVTVPLVRTSLEADLLLRDDDDATLGLNPALVSPDAVTGFLEILNTRAADASALASQLCGADPGSAGCASATALAGTLTDARPALGAAYGASGLFPAQGTAGGEALLAWFQSVEASLAAQGLDPLGVAPPLAASVADIAALQSLLADPGGPFAASPLESLGGLWGIGDVEARVAIRVLGGERVDTLGTPTLAWSLAGVGTVRLPTGARDSMAVFLDRGRGDGQLDLEGTVFGALATRRLAVRARATWLLQNPGEIEHRILPYGSVFAGRGDRARLDFDPGDGLQVEVEPALRIAPALTLAASWRFLRLGQDRYTRLDPLPGAPDDGSPIPDGRYHTDATLLEEGTEVRLHEVGGSLTYRSVGLPETESGGFEAFLRVRQAVSGSGGRVPAGLRAEFGLRFVRSLWGG